MQETQETQATEEIQATPERGTFPAAAGLATVASAALAACGGGGDEPASPGTNERASAQALLSTSTDKRAAAWRLLNQATLGPTSAEVDWVTTNGVEAWLTRQFGYSVPTRSYGSSYLELVSTGGDWDVLMTESWWRVALGSADQLRQRVVHALIQILVISTRDDTVGFRPYMAASYMDVLAKHAFGSFRDLIEAVAKAPAMGAYLSHFANQPPEPGRRIPDQNFARELIQLFTIGLTRLNMDGSVILDGNGRPVSTTVPTDIPVLSNVFTGWALDDDAALNTTVTVIKDGVTTLEADQVDYFGDLTRTQRSRRYALPMKGYASYHSTQAQMETQVGVASGTATLLGESFTLGSTPQESLTKALDVIFRHPNIAPFIVRQMIQRMVTSNPSPAYIQRVATAFKNAQWSMTALIRAILTDTEATSATTAKGSTYGKVREPLLRITHLLRAFSVKDARPYHTSEVSSTTARVNLNQGPVRAPSVFNYYSPTYRYAGGLMAAQGKVAPEMQIITEASAVAYLNALYAIIEEGMSPDQSQEALRGQINLTEETNAAGTPSAVAGLINKKLFGGTMSSALLAIVTEACTPVAGSTASALERARAALFIAAASPEYIVQK